MISEPPPSPSRGIPWSALAAVALGGSASAQEATAPRAGNPGSTAFLRVFERLDAPALVAIVVGALIFVLLALRIVAMIRRERPKAVVAAPRRRPVSGGDPLDRVTVAGNTDWGFDQNARAAVTRSEIVPGGAPRPLQASTSLWSTSDVHNAANISMQANDGMGKPTNLPPSPYRTSHNPYYRGDQATVVSQEIAEVADTLLQAELLVQLGDPKQAMILLSQHIRDTPQPGPAVWLMLLDLYQTTGRKSQYEALANGFGTLFNAAVPPWATSSDVLSRDLESYPQVLMKLQTGWPDDAMRPLLESLLNDNRGGSRQGFSLAAYRDILFLLELLDAIDQMAQEEIDRDVIRRKRSGIE